MASGAKARAALERHGFRFTHSLGQNFILDDGLIARIAEGRGRGAGGQGAGDRRGRGRFDP